MKKIIFRFSDKIFLTLFFMGLVFSVSCGSKAPKTGVRKNIVYNTITHRICKEDTTQSYEVYLPSGYVSGRTYPVMYAFDSHADGKLAVEHLKMAAEVFGYIIVGSDNSKNGLQTLDHTLDVLLRDVASEIKPDENRQYAAGFSGGGRVASYLAAKTGKIRGIITCGAGMGGFKPQTAASKFDIFAIAGRGDFNYDEVMALQQQFSGTDWRYVCTAFDGGHAWPPVNLFTNAVLWFQLNAMKDGLIPKDEQLIDQTLDSINFQYAQMTGAGQYMRAADECRKGIAFIGGLHSTGKLEKKLKDLQVRDEYLNEVKKAEELQLTEQQLKDNYLQSFAAHDLSWWKSEIAALSGRVRSEKDSASRQMFSRIQGFLGIVCYSYTAQAVKGNDDAMAIKCLGIYQTLEPTNPDCFFYKAEFLDKKGKYEEAADTLKKAMELGFKEMSKARESLSGQTLKRAGVNL